jgi:hypothetical protein
MTDRIKGSKSDNFVRIARRAVPVCMLPGVNGKKKSLQRLAMPTRPIVWLSRS